MINKSLAYYLGNTLILVSIIGLGYTFWPIIREEWEFAFGKPTTFTIDNQFSLSIPSLKIYAPIIKEVDPFNPKAYTQALTKGIAQAKGTATPDQVGMMYLFAHSSEAPWLMTRQNTAFYRLPKINLGDEIQIRYQAHEYRYRVTEKKIVWPNEINYLQPSPNKQLILQTCYPVGTDFKRLLVFAEPS